MTGIENETSAFAGSATGVGADFPNIVVQVRKWTHLGHRPVFRDAVAKLISASRYHAGVAGLGAQMRRREFLNGGMAAAWPVVGRAQHQKMPVIVLVSGRSPGYPRRPGETT